MPSIAPIPRPRCRSSTGSRRLAADRHGSTQDVSERPERAEGHERPNEPVRPERRHTRQGRVPARQLGAPVEGSCGGAKAVVRLGSFLAGSPRADVGDAGPSRQFPTRSSRAAPYAPRSSSSSAMGAPVEGSSGGDEAVVRLGSFLAGSPQADVGDAGPSRQFPTRSSQAAPIRAKVEFQLGNWGRQSRDRAAALRPWFDCPRAPGTDLERLGMQGLRANSLPVRPERSEATSRDRAARAALPRPLSSAAV